ncbi:Reverse transcriptase domain [Trinorchestia longiramus]|nr:Reverse transcriptase domain [Trinorchestia longiramus]
MTTCPTGKATSRQPPTKQSPPSLTEQSRESNQHKKHSCSKHDTNTSATTSGDTDTPLASITLQELKQALQTFSQKASGHTKITTHHLKQLPLDMLQYLLYIFNNAISAGYFPIKLKHTIMIFLPKPSTSQHEIKNYRPISLLDIHGKLLDKILTYRLTDHLTIHNIYNKRQHDFRHGKGTHTALATLHEMLHIHLNQRHTIDVILRDVSKAFDKVWHTGLKYKLSQLNLHPLFTKILANFLSDRTAANRIANHTEQPFPIKSGVPQGAVISPALYNFYTHDLPPPIPNTDYIAFADDITQITFSPNSRNMAARLTSRVIAQINAFERKWKIQTNANKFKLIAISRRNKHQVRIDNTPLPYDKSGKVLGLHLSSQGYTSHITQRKAVAQNNLSCLYRLKHMHPDTKRKLYLAYVRSALIYPVILLHTLSPSSISKLQSVQNKATRFITNAKWHDFNTSAQLHRQTKLTPINTLLHEHAKKYGLTLNKCTHNYTYTSHSHKKLDKYHTELSQARKQKYSAPLQHPYTHDTSHHHT